MCVQPLCNCISIYAHVKITTTGSYAIVSTHENTASTDRSEVMLLLLLLCLTQLWRSEFPQRDSEKN